MVNYEMVFVVDSRLPDAEKAEIEQHVKEAIEKFSGQIKQSSVWLEKQRFSFPMKKVWEGTYYLMQIEIDGNEVAKLRRSLQIMERLLRFLIVKIEDPKKQNKKG